MWLLIFIFLIITLVIAWCFFGYFIFVWLLGLLGKKDVPELPKALPTVSILVSCLNEAEQILDKLQNIRELDYPRHLLEVFFVDGGSTDETVQLLCSEIRADEPYCKVVRASTQGKIAQLNQVLPQAKGEIIVNTDVDALLAADALTWIAAEFNAGEDVLVVGAFCRPGPTIDIEKYHWDAQNKSRLLESDAGSSSIVIAPCYAFRRDLLDAFPEDVVADDIFVAFTAHAKKGKVVYSRYATAVETRNPQTYREFIPHKFRKSNAFLRESLRFLYLLPQMDSFDKTMFITRLAQQILLPWAFLFWLLLVGALSTFFRLDLVAINIIFMALLFILTSGIFKSVVLPQENPRFTLLTAAKGYIITLAIMLTTGISYPYFKQVSSYSRIKGGPPGEGPDACNQSDG